MADFRIAERLTGFNEGGYANNKADAISFKINNALLTMSNQESSVIFKNEKADYVCSIDGCIRKGYSKGMCHAHYKRKQVGMDMTLPIKNRKSNAICKTCSKPLKGKGGWNLCQNHYNKERLRIIKQTLVDEMGGKCSSCEKSYPLAVYDFHHLSNKTFSVSKMIGINSINLIVLEVLKCELLCANCHRIKHNI